MENHIVLNGDYLIVVNISVPSVDILFAFVTFLYFLISLSFDLLTTKSKK